MTPIDWMIGAPHDLPGVAVVVDVAAPGQRLVADAQAALGGALAELAEIIGGAVDAAERGRRDVAADQQQIGAAVPASGRTCARRGRNCARAAAPACPRNRGTAGTRRSRDRDRGRAARRRAGLPPNDSRSFSKISTASKPAAAMARSFSSSAPLSETVAIERLVMRPAP